MYLSGFFSVLFNVNWFNSIAAISFSLVYFSKKGIFKIHYMTMLCMNNHSSFSLEKRFINRVTIINTFTAFVPIL